MQFHKTTKGKHHTWHIESDKSVFPCKYTLTSKGVRTIPSSFNHSKGLPIYAPNKYKIPWALKSYSTWNIYIYSQENGTWGY